jgi:omega-amidase
LELKILALQTDIYWENPAMNFANISELFSSYSTCDLIILPEMFNTGFSMDSGKIAEKSVGESLEWLKSFAKTKEAVVVASLAILENDKYFNRLYCVYPNGDLEQYNKRHLFRMAGENQHYEAGEKNITINIKGIRIRPLICYDLRFPIWSRNQLNNEYDCLIYIANWPAVRSLAWTSLLQARAIENQAYVVGVNRVGIDGNDVEYSGDSRVFDFTGARLDTFKPHKTEVQEVDLKMNLLEEFRKNFPSGMDSDKFTLL